MIEITAIILQLLFFILVFSFPLNPVILNNILKSKKYFFGVFDTLLINAVFILNILIISSYLNFDLNILFYLLIGFSIVINIFYLNNWSEYLVKEKISIVFFLIICVCLFFDLSNFLKFEWDGIAHWFFKTKLFYDGHTIDNIKNLPAPMYPHLGPYLWAFFWKNSIVEYEYLGRLIYIFIYILSIFSMSCSIFKGKKYNNFFLLPITLFFILLTYDEYLFGGYQEYLLFSFIALISKLILNIIDNNSPTIKQLLILVFAGNLLIYFKDEGLIYLIIIFFIFQFFLKQKKQKIFLISLAIVMILIQFFLEKNIIQVYGFQESVKIDFDYILDINFLINNSILIFKYLLISFLKYPLWIITFLSTYILIKQKFDQKLLIHLLMIIFSILSFYFLLYIIHPYSSEFLMKVTLDRLMFQTSGFFIIYVLISFDTIYLNLNKYFKK